MPRYDCLAFFIIQEAQKRWLHATKFKSSRGLETLQRPQVSSPREGWASSSINFSLLIDLFVKKSNSVPFYFALTAPLLFFILSGFTVSCCRLSIDLFMASFSSLATVPNSCYIFFYCPWYYSKVCLPKKFLIFIEASFFSWSICLKLVTVRLMKRHGKRWDSSVFRYSVAFWVSVCLFSRYEESDIMGKRCVFDLKPSRLSL